MIRPDSRSRRGDRGGGPASGDAAAVRVWSAVWFRAVARLAVVGVGTGSLTGAALGLIVVALERGTPSEVGGPLLFGLAAGAAFALPVVLLSAETGLVVAARVPQHRAATLALLLVWPMALTAVVVSPSIGDGGYGLGPSLLGAGALLLLVAAAVLRTSRWVTAPLR